MNNHNSKSGLFLMEMMIVIFFFSICAAICTNVFAGARITANHSKDLNNAVVRATSAAEAFKVSGGDMEKTQELLKLSSNGNILITDESADSVTISYGDKTTLVLSLLDDAGDGTATASVKVYSTDVSYDENRQTDGAARAADGSAPDEASQDESGAGAEIYSIEVKTGGGANA